MFYVCLFSSGFFMFITVSRIALVTMGLSHDLVSIFMFLALEAATLSLMIKELKKPHKRALLLKALGLWFMYYGLFFLASTGNSLEPIETALRLDFGLVILAMGMILIDYNKKEKNQLDNRVPLPVTELGDDLFSLVYEIELLLQLKTVQENSELYNDLERIELIAQTAIEKNIAVSQSLITNSIKLLSEYNKAIQIPAESIEEIESILKTEEQIKKLKTSFEIVYRKKQRQEVGELDQRVDTLNQQLKLNGLVESDFK